jgi:hypothetical protein
MKRIKLISTVVILALIITPLLLFSGSHSPWDGTGWDVTSPDIDQPHGNAYKEIYDLRKGVGIRIDKEHITLAGSSAGGEHLQGSARAWFQDAVPALQPDGSALAATDKGMMWFDSNATPDNLAYVLVDHSDPTEGNGWQKLSTSLSGETFTWTANHTWDDGTTDSPTLTLQDATNETFAIVKLDDGDTTATIPADTDFEIVTGNLAVGDGTPGTAAMDGEDAYIEGALEVDGVATLDGNATVGGTLNVTGVATFTVPPTWTQATVDNNTALNARNAADDGNEAIAIVDGSDNIAFYHDVDGTNTAVYTKYLTGTLDSDSFPAKLCKGCSKCFQRI